MRTPVDDGPWLFLDETASTQDVATEYLSKEEGEVPGIVFAKNQLAGRGRFQREWHSIPGQSLTMSFVCLSYADHPRPWLVGMAVALAVAGAVDGMIRWPNDVHLGGKKVGGILTELISADRFGKVPVIGVGVNLNQNKFPADIEHNATSLFKETGREHDALELAKSIISRINDMPEPEIWDSIEPVWSVFDDTPGKPYLLATGETATAVRVGESGELICKVNGEERFVLAGEAIFGKD